MSRYRTYAHADEPAAQDADLGFSGVDERHDPRQLGAGIVSRAVNKTFTRGVAVTRPGFGTIGWASQHAVDFPLNFRGQGYTFYDLFTADVACLSKLNFRVYNGDTFQLLCPATGLWHTVWIQLAGVPTLTVDPVGMSGWVYAPEAAEGNRNYRLWMDRTFQLLCPATGLWHTLYLQNVAGAVALAIDATGVASDATYSPATDANWILAGGTTFQLISKDYPLPKSSRWHTLTIAVVAGIPTVAIDENGNDEAGFDFDKVQGFGTVYGSCVFADPLGNEGALIATQDGVWRIAANAPPQIVYLPDSAKITSTVRMVQCFDRVIMFRGQDLEPLQWNPRQTFADGVGRFETVTQTNARNSDPDNGHGDGTERIPNASDGTFFNNRLYVPTNRDELAVSDVLDYTRYSVATQRFKINNGDSDAIVKIVPFNQTTLVVFKQRSVYMLTNVAGNLSAINADVLTSEYGLVGPDAYASVGNDVWFLCEKGVLSIHQVLDNKLQADNDPLTGPIDPVIRRINWSHAGNAQMEQHENLMFIAVPLDGATYNNAILVYDFLNQGWSGYWTGRYFDIQAFIKCAYAGKRRLMMIHGDNLSTSKAFGAVSLFGQGFEDYLFGTTAQIEDEVITRGYALGSMEDKRFGRLIVDIATLNPSYSIDAIVDGANEVISVRANITRDRTKYFAFGTADYDPSNSNDDSAAPYREDYSVLLGTANPGVYCGSGLSVEQRQRLSDALRIGARGSYAQLRIRNTQGELALHGVMPEAQSGKRGYGLRA